MPNEYLQYWPKFFTTTIFNWQPLQNQTLSTIQHSFLKHTAQVFKADLFKTNPTLLENY
jgi:hypothetical protein